MKPTRGYKLAGVPLALRHDAARSTPALRPIAEARIAAPDVVRGAPDGPPEERRDLRLGHLIGGEADRVLEAGVGNSNGVVDRILDIRRCPAPPRAPSYSCPCDAPWDATPRTRGWSREILGRGVGRMPPTDAEGRGAGRRETGGARAWSRSRRPLQQPAFAEGGRRARLRDLGGQAEVGENLPDDGRVLDGRDELHSATPCFTTSGRSSGSGRPTPRQRWAVSDRWPEMDRLSRAHRL